MSSLMGTKVSSAAGVCNPCHVNRIRNYDTILLLLLGILSPRVETWLPNKQKGLIITSLSAFNEFIHKDFLKKPLFSKSKLNVFFKKSIFGCHQKLKNIWKYSLFKNTLKIHVIIALLTFYDFMQKNSLLGALCRERPI